MECGPQSFCAQHSKFITISIPKVFFFKEKKQKKKMPLILGIAINRIECFIVEILSRELTFDWVIFNYTNASYYFTEIPKKKRTIRRKRSSSLNELFAYNWLRTFFDKRYLNRKKLK